MKIHTSSSQERLSPSDLMRARHPDLYSDTQVTEEPMFSRAIFEYYLDTLTSRKQEYEFEHFCRKLAEKELCPNLVIQTGPTGGGDSKVDSETYPVAEEIAERWWTGMPSAGLERWAFAFSAKKSWKPKVTADVNNILSTGRDYNQIYFFTNQYVKDKDRSLQEDSLSKHAGVPVHIVDRSWIIEKVFENKRFDLAISTLKIEVENDKKVCHGPRDMARLTELEELDRLIADPDRYVGARYQLVEDCLRTAILARGLERPRNEVESRFAQTEKLSQKMDLRQQRLRIAYNRAWTAFWWYEDYADFICFYDEVEKRVIGSDQAHDGELLLNLWHLLISSVRDGKIRAQDASTDSRRQRLQVMLEANAADPARLNNALEARTSLALLKLNQAFLADRSDLMDEVWHDLSKILDKTSRLGNYSVERLSDVIKEIAGNFDSPGFDALYEKLVAILRERRSDGEAGEAFSKRGMDKLDSGKPYEAIQWFGRAEELLINEEYRGELVKTLIVSSYAYERVGLLWAARAKALAALERTITTFNETGEMAPHALYAAKRLVWIELQLGRIPHILGEMQLADFIATHSKMSEAQKNNYEEEREIQDSVLGVHFLNLSMSALPDVERLPDCLERLGNFTARMALLFALGHEQELRTEGTIPATETADTVQSFFEQYQDQPAAKDIPRHPILVSGETTLLKTIILGAELRIEISNNFASFAIAESLLGVFEAFMATSNVNDVLPFRECVSIRLKPSEDVVSLSPVNFPEGAGWAEVTHPTEFRFTTADEWKSFIRWLRDQIPALVGYMFISSSPLAWFEKLAGQERAFSRALSFGDALTLTRNVHGQTHKLLLSDWFETSDKSYALLRDQQWRISQFDAQSDPKEAGVLHPFGLETPPIELLDNAKRKHSDFRVLSPIDLPLWNRAKWNAVGYGYESNLPPFLALIFEDGDAAKLIFSAWKSQCGDQDEGDMLRLSIITGISKANPAEYAVTIGPNISSMLDSGVSKIPLVLSRMHRMVPTSSKNLDIFLAEYNRFESYFLVPAAIDNGCPAIFNEYAIAKGSIQVRPAWQIGENDPDSFALFSDDDPIIPADVSTPPVARALARIRAGGKRR